jgi:oligopeptide transport system permease protein
MGDSLDIRARLGISEEDLRAATPEERQSADRMRPSVSYWTDAMRRFRRNHLAMAMLALIILIILAAVLVPVFSPYTYKMQTQELRQGSSWSHPMGTDRLGRDTFTRVMWGTRISLLVGVVTMVLVLLIGLIYGGIAAWVGGMVDNLMMRFVDFMMTIPSLLLIILLSVIIREPLQQMLTNPRFSGIASIGSGLLSIFVVFALFNWVGMARSVRGALLMNRNQEYVLAAQAMGARSRWIVMKHLIPNSIGVVIISATAIVPNAIMTESFLSFIGLGVSAPVPSLGSMCSDALNGIVSFPMNMVYPAIMISLIILCFNVLGDALRDALDPRLRK